MKERKEEGHNPSKHSVLGRRKGFTANRQEKLKYFEWGFPTRNTFETRQSGSSEKRN